MQPLIQRPKNSQSFPQLLVLPTGESGWVAWVSPSPVAPGAVCCCNGAHTHPALQLLPKEGVTDPTASSVFIYLTTPLVYSPPFLTSQQCRTLAKGSSSTQLLAQGAAAGQTSLRVITLVSQLLQLLMSKAWGAPPGSNEQSLGNSVPKKFPF